MTAVGKSFIEVQFPIGPVSLESYKERKANHAQVLKPLGKWWGEKPLVLTRAIILGSVLPAAADPAQWPDDLDIFLRCMTMDDAGMWKRKTERLPAKLCYLDASPQERLNLFDDPETWSRRNAGREARLQLEQRVFFSLDYIAQRDYCCRVEEIDGPPPESWLAINGYLGTSASTLAELIEELAVRRYGTRLKVGDAFSGMGSIPFEAAELGCDVFAADINPVACLLTWGALNIIGGTAEFREAVRLVQEQVYDETEHWLMEKGFESSEEGWRGETYFYCLEIQVPEWDGWLIPVSPSWVISKKNRTWVDLIPVEQEKRFEFRIRSGGSGYALADEGTKRGQEIVCPTGLWELFRRGHRHHRMPRAVRYNQLIEDSGGLRRWDRVDVVPRSDDILQERLYCIRWKLPSLKSLLVREQQLRYDAADVRQREDVDGLIRSLLSFLSPADISVLDRLRSSNWLVEERQCEEITQEIEGLGKAIGTVGVPKVLRERLKTLKSLRRQREAEVGRLAAKIPSVVYREPLSHDREVEQAVALELQSVFEEWQGDGWIPNWRIEEGQETNRLTRERGWTHWHHLFNARQLLLSGRLSRAIDHADRSIKPALLLSLGKVLNQNARLCSWDSLPGIEKTHRVYYNQALNTLFSYGCRGLVDLRKQAVPSFSPSLCLGQSTISLADARAVRTGVHVWITDPPYADAVNYEELSEFFLAWYVPHLRAAFPDWYTDSMRQRAVKGDDAPFRVAMAECYKNLANHMPDHGMQILMFTHKSTDVWEDLALIMWAAGLQVKQVWSVATETPGAGIRTGNYVQATYNMVLRKRTGNNVGFVDFITPQVNKRVKEVITRMRESQIATGLARCGYTDTDYLLAAQAAAAEVVTGFASIDGVDLDAELRTPNKERGRSALRSLMDNAKRTATDFLVPPAMDRAIAHAKCGDAYQFWRQFAPEEKFLLKGLEGESQGVFKLGAFQDLGRAYGLTDYEGLLGPTRANDTRTVLPDELPRPEALRFEEVPASDRGLWRHSPTRHIYHALKLLTGGAEVERAVKHLADSTDFWNLHTTRLAAILTYLREVTAHLDHWAPYQNALTQLALGIEHYRG